MAGDDTPRHDSYQTGKNSKPEPLSGFTVEDDATADFSTVQAFRIIGNEVRQGIRTIGENEDGDSEGDSPGAASVPVTPGRRRRVVVGTLPNFLRAPGTTLEE